MMDLQRLDIGNALYYVELKSNGHRPLFSERSGFSAFVELLANLEERSGATTIAYCLLQDSIHLIVQNGGQPLQSSTQALMQEYTQFTQQQWKHHGSLFHKHPHSLLLEPSRYLLPCIQYIHQRPVEMGLVAEASIYPWSSLQAYTGEQPQAWLNTTALQQFTGLALHRRNSHLNCLSQPPTQTLDLQQGNHSQVWALAGNDFIERLLNRSQGEAELPNGQWLQQQLCEHHHIEPCDLNLRHGHRRHLEIRAEIAALFLEFHAADRNGAAQPQEPKPVAPSAEEFAHEAAETVVDKALKLQLEALLAIPFELLQPLILTLRETRANYLHTLYLHLKAQWQASATAEGVEIVQPHSTENAPYPTPSNSPVESSEHSVLPEHQSEEKSVVSQ